MATGVANLRREACKKITKLLIWLSIATSPMMHKERVEADVPSRTRPAQIGLLFTVNTTTDTDDVLVGDGFCVDSNGKCSLRAAIEEANFGLGEDGIEFDVPVTDPGFDGTAFVFTLTRALPDISDSLSITGLGADMLKIHPIVQTRIFNVTDAGTVTFSGLTIFEGFVPSEAGGGIRNVLGATVNVNNCTLTSNSALSGGAIANSGTGTMNVSNCTLTSNIAFNGGAIDHFSSGTLNVTDCTITDNGADGQGGGISKSFSVGTVNIDGCTFLENIAATGGAISTLGSMVVTNSTISSNTATDSGAGIHSLAGGTLDIINCLISNNEALEHGGGIDNVDSALNLTDSTVNGNSAAGGGGGGGIFNGSAGTLIVTRSTLSGNFILSSGAGGGGIANQGIMSLTNSTLSANFTTDSGGAAVFNESTETVNVTNCTISGNIAGGGSGCGGLFNSLASIPVNVRSTIVALNEGPPAVDVVGDFTTKGFNLIGQSDCCAGFTENLNNDQVGSSAAPLDPKLDPNGLQDRGGPTQTIALLPGSPALDHGTSLSLNGDFLTTDQRGDGFPRVFDQDRIPNGPASDGTDIGAFELETPIPSTLANISTRLQVETGDNVLIGGFIITGTDAKKVLLRAIGPSLPLDGFLADPLLELHDKDGNVITTNDNWETNLNQQDIIATGLSPNNPFESALLMTLEPDAYTAIVRGVRDTTGVALVEAYDLDATVDSQLGNISSRGLVQTGDDVMIGGFIIVGTDPRAVLILAIGPSLPVTGKLADPTLELHDKDGALIASNDNWRTDQEADIEATGLPPANDLEAAILQTLVPDLYTAIVRGAGGTTGVALVEIFALN